VALTTAELRDRQKFTEMGAIWFEDRADTGEEYETMQLTQEELAG
jgi:hypothetical protein